MQLLPKVLAIDRSKIVSLNHLNPVSSRKCCKNACSSDSSSRKTTKIKASSTRPVIKRFIAPPRNSISVAAPFEIYVMCLHNQSTRFPKLFKLWWFRISPLFPRVRVFPTESAGLNNFRAKWRIPTVTVHFAGYSRSGHTWLERIRRRGLEDPCIANKACLCVRKSQRNRGNQAHGPRLRSRFQMKAGSNPGSGATLFCSVACPGVTL